MDVTARHPATPHRALLARICAIALAAGLLGGCGGDGDTGTADPAPSPAASETVDGGEATAEEVVITIEEFAYELPDSVPPGAEITVRNVDGVGHTVTADDGETFDVIVGPSAQTTFTAPSEPGEYPFHCTPHPAMTATLVVEADG